MKPSHFKSIAFSIGLLLLVGAGCKSTKKAAVVEETTAYMEPAAKLGDNVKYSFNDGRSFVLAQSTPDPNGNSLSFSFLVFDMKAEKVVLEQTVESGFVQWLSQEEIEVFFTPGIMRNDQSRDDFTTVYNVVTGKSMPKTDWKK